MNFLKMEKLTASAAIFSTNNDMSKAKIPYDMDRGGEIGK